MAIGSLMTSAPEQPTLEDALRDREEGMAAADHAADLRWRAVCDRVIAQLAASGDEFTADEVRSLIGAPVARSANAMGPRFAAAARDGTIELVGYRPSLRPAARGRILRVWRGTG